MIVYLLNLTYFGLTYSFMTDLTLNLLIISNVAFCVLGFDSFDTVILNTYLQHKYNNQWVCQLIYYVALIYYNLVLAIIYYALVSYRTGFIPVAGRMQLK